MGVNDFYTVAPYRHNGESLFGVFPTGGNNFPCRLYKTPEEAKTYAARQREKEGLEAATRGIL